MEKLFLIPTFLLGRQRGFGLAQLASFSYVAHRQGPITEAVLLLLCLGVWFPSLDLSRTGAAPRRLSFRVLF